MKICILSDIHANLPALQSVLDKISSLKVDKLVSCGDFVGYNPYPSEVMKWAMSVNIKAVKGNHDAGVTGELSLDWFNRMAQEAVIWTQGHLDPVALRWLKELPTEFELDEIPDAIFVHGALTDPWEYIVDVYSAWRNLLALEERGKNILFFGHSHIPVIFFGEKEDIKYIHPVEPEKPYRLEEGKRYLINCGSVGQPRDGDPRACFVVFDTDERTVTFYRVEYDVSKVALRINLVGLPPLLGERLKVGR